MNSSSVMEAVVYACRRLLPLAIIASFQIFCMSGNQDDPCPEFTLRKLHGAEQHDKKSKKRSTYNTPNKSESSQLQKKKLHGKGHKPLNNIVQQSAITMLIEVHILEDDAEQESFTAAIVRHQNTVNEQ